MTAWRWSALTAVVFLGVSAAGPTAARAHVLVATGPWLAAAQSADGPDSAAADELLALTNRERSANGLAPLTPRADIAAVAGDHSATMASRREIFHNDAYFSSATKSRLALSAVGENVGQAGSIASVHAALMNSAPHRANILNGSYQVVGVAVVWASGQVFITEDFGVPKGGAVSSAAAPTTAPPAPRPVTTRRPTPPPAAPAAPRPRSAPSALPATTTAVAAATTAEPETSTTSAPAPPLPDDVASPPVRTRAAPHPLLVFAALLVLVVGAVAVRHSRRALRP